MLSGKTILVTGGAGSIGSELVRQLLELNPKQVRALDINETALFYLGRELNKENLRTFIGDVRDRNRLNRAMENVDLVFHAAALKHVPLCESDPFEAVKTNVFGTQNVIDSALLNGVEKVINISTDKAVDPVSVMGSTKLLAERLITSAHFIKGSKKTLFSSVRFGNVLGSRGAVIEIFNEQIRSGLPVTITHKDMTRFFMSISEAVKLCIVASDYTKDNEIFILKMPSVKIIDLAKVLIEELAPKFSREPEDIRIEFIGLRNGEKMYESLMTEDEAENVIENESMFVLPSRLDFSRKKGPPKIPKNAYRSDMQKLLTKTEIKTMLEKCKII